jgi:hypothetical protein
MLNTRGRVAFVTTNKRNCFGNFYLTEIIEITKNDFKLIEILFTYTIIQSYKYCASITKTSIHEITSQQLFVTILIALPAAQFFLQILTLASTLSLVTLGKT